MTRKPFPYAARELLFPVEARAEGGGRGMRCKNLSGGSDQSGDYGYGNALVGQEGQPFLNRHVCKSPDGGLYHHHYADPEESRSALYRPWWPVQPKSVSYLALRNHVVQWPIHDRGCLVFRNWDWGPSDRVLVEISN